MNDASRTRWVWLAVLLVALLAAWPELSQPGLLNTRGGGDSPFLLQRLHQLETAVLDGHFPVRWMPDANYGYGYPFYNFYAPLSVYLTFLFRLLGFSFVRAIHLSHLLGYFVAGLSTFALAKRWFRSNWAGLLAAAAYTIAPFHLVNVYVRGDSLAEFWAMAFYPLVILAADGLFGGGRRQVALFALAYAALILSHNISAMIFSPFLLLYLLLKTFLPQRTQRGQSTEQSPVSNLQSLISSLFLALALAAWFFIPALAEQSLAQLGTVTSGYFHYSNHFLGTADFPLSQTSFFVDYGVVNREAFRMGLVQTAVTILGMLALLWLWQKQRKRRAMPAIFILLTVAVSSFMLTPLSTLLWKHLPLLSFTQFPWRFLSVQAFGGAMAVGAMAVVLPWPRWWTLPLTVLLLVSSLGRLDPDHLPLTDADVTAESLAQYEWFTGNIGTTISFEYLPPTVQPRPYTSSWLNTGNRWQLTPLTGEIVSAELAEQQTSYQQWRVETADPAKLIFPTLHWPGWEAQVNGKAVAIRPSAGSGLIELDVPAGVHEIELTLGRTAVRLWAELASLLAVLGTIWLLKPQRSWLNRQTSLAVGGLLLLAVGLRLWPGPAPLNGLRTWDFVQMGYLHSSDEITFRSGAVLRGYELSETAVTAGQSVQVELFWEVPPTTAMTISLVSPAANWPEIDAPLLAAQTLPAGQQVSTATLLLPKNAPAGLFVPRLKVADDAPLTLTGSSRDQLYLTPIRILPAANAFPLPDQLAVRGIDVQPAGDDQLAVQLAWFTPQTISQNYNVALRLADAQGKFVRVWDGQPGYGFLPSSGWRAGEWVHDWLTIPLPPPDEVHERPFILVAQLYEVAEPNQVVLTRRLGEVLESGAEVVFEPAESVFELPDEMVGVTAVFGDEIQLHGYRFSQNDDVLDLTLVWQALANGQTEYTRFVHLIPADVGGAPLVQNDSPPRYGSYPTSQWTAGEVVEERLSLSLAGVLPGKYQLAVGFYSQPVSGQFNLLPAADAAGELVPDGRFVLPITVIR
ncbi:6-pyruvoyl-tetrahydropterin synthase-related protein [Candidatus Leptofilum sp.]|uniref:6-pyruvoyl-tetrahydropterin synthase-related protein n=1 Tax=Candidatus Leptofilum sp. TaxID=3241576 RepID=UPI003B5C8B70